MADDLEAMAAAAADRHGIPKGWFLSLIGKGEGGFRAPDATSPKGAEGPGQLMPGTARAEGVDPTDHAQNIEGAARYASQLWYRYKGNARLAAAAYNAGPANADKHGENWDAYPKPQETKPYVERVGLPSAEDLLDTKRLPSAESLLDAKPKAATPRQRAMVASQASDQAHAAATRAQQYADDARAQANRGAGPTLGPRIAGDVATAGKAQAQGLAEDVGARWKAASGQLAADLAPPKPNNLRETLMQAGRQAEGPIALAGDLMGEAGAPILGALDYGLGRPAEKATGINRQTVGNYASLALPALGEVAGDAALAGRARGAGVAPETLRASETARAATRPSSRAAPIRTGPQGEHDARVARLVRKDVDLTPGQIKGGEANVAEQQSRSSSLRGGAIREARVRAQDSWNRAMANDALAPIGQKYEGAEVGRPLIEQVSGKIGAAYDRVLPQARMKPDEKLAETISHIKEDDEELLGPYKGSFDAIVKSRVLNRLGPDRTMDGRTWKEVESELSSLSAGYRRSNDGAQHILADSIDKLNGALRDNMERSSPAGVRPQIKAANRAWAMYKRLEDASTRRATSGGRFTPGDLQQAVKKGSTRGAFGSGKALMQREADDAQAVMGATEPDSGTAGRLNRTRPIAGPAIGAALGSIVGHGSPIADIGGAALGSMVETPVRSVTNALADTLLRNQARRELVRRGLAQPRNYLKGIDQRVMAPRLLTLPAAAQSTQQQ